MSHYPGWGITRTLEATIAEILDAQRERVQ
jgi:hypothetical protein